MIKSTPSAWTRTVPIVIALCGAFAPSALLAKCGAQTGTELGGSEAVQAAMTSHPAHGCLSLPNFSSETAITRAPASPAPSSPLDLAWVSPLRLGQPAESEKAHGYRWDMGDRAIDISGFRAKSHPYGTRAPNLLTDEDRSAFWGGDIAFGAALGSDNSLALTLDGALGKQRSAFTPQVAHRYSSQSLGAALVWHHDRSVALAAGFRTNRVSVASAPLARLAARAAGSPIEASGAHITATFWPIAARSGVGERARLALTLDAFSQRLSASDAAIFNGNGGRADSGVTLTLKARF